MKHGGGGFKFLALSISCAEVPPRRLDAGWAERGPHTHALTHLSTIASYFLIYYHHRGDAVFVLAKLCLLDPEKQPVIKLNVILLGGSYGFSLPLCVLPRSHGLHGTWQRAGRSSSSEENGPAKPCEGWSDPQTSRLEEETPTATSFPQGAHAVLEQGGYFLQPEVKTISCGGEKKCLLSCLCLCLPTFCQVRVL